MTPDSVGVRADISWNSVVDPVALPRFTPSPGRRTFTAMSPTASASVVTSSK